MNESCYGFEWDHLPTCHGCKVFNSCRQAYRKKNPKGEKMQFKMVCCNVSIRPELSADRDLTVLIQDYSCEKCGNHAQLRAYIKRKQKILIGL